MRTLYAIAALILIPTNVFAFGACRVGGAFGWLGTVSMAGAAIAGYWVLKRSRLRLSSPTSTLRSRAR